MVRTADLSARFTNITGFVDKSAVRTINGRLRGGSLIIMPDKSGNTI